MKLILLVCSVTAMTAALLGSAALPSSARAADVVTEWSNVKAPPAPALKPVTVDPKTILLANRTTLTSTARIKF